MADWPVRRPQVTAKIEVHPVVSALFFSRAGVVRAVDDVSFPVGRGESMGLVGENGSGKPAGVFFLLGPLDAPGHLNDLPARP